MLKRLRRGAAILDCACGTGLQLAEMLRRGYHVTGSDADAAMVEEARRMAERNHTPARFVVSEWKDLPRAFRVRFDLVLCCGNSIGHCRNESEMVASLKGMRAVMNPGGRLIVDSRNWEKIRREKARYTTFGFRDRGSDRAVTLYIWNFPRGFSAPHTIKVVLIIREGGKVAVRSYPIVYHPFRRGQLVRAMRKAGLTAITSDYRRENERYRVHARRP